MKNYSTSEVARIIGVHPNTIRNYESFGFIPKPLRKTNGYRIFTDIHIGHCRLVRKAFEVEIVQNGLRKAVVAIILTAAKQEYVSARAQAQDYLQSIRDEKSKALEAIAITQQIITGDETILQPMSLTRKKTAEYLGVTIDALRNWELNGLLTARRKENGYRIYNEDDIRVLKIIRTLRCADYSLSAILRMLQALSKNSKTDIKTIIDTPEEDEIIISVCDKLLSSLERAEENAIDMIDMIDELTTAYKRSMQD